MKSTKKTLNHKGKTYTYFSLPTLAKKEGADLSRIPYCIRTLLESLLRNHDDSLITKDDVLSLLNWNEATPQSREIAFLPARVIMQDLTGVPAIVDLAALRNAMRDLGGDPKKINPQIPVDLIIDHSVQIDFSGTNDAFEKNIAMEFKRNSERYTFLKWGQNSFSNFTVIPPSNGIIHQVNLEYLGKIVTSKVIDGERIAYPDTLIGTDSHTTMINGLAILGWGVGGIEAEAAMLGQPIYMLIPEVVGVKLEGTLKEGVTATDLVLAITNKLRSLGVVGKFVEFYGEGAKSLSLADRATISNMAPEYGATMGYFGADEETLEFMKQTGRSEEHIDFVKTYLKEQRLFWDGKDTPEYTQTLTIDISKISSLLAGPKRPQDSLDFDTMKSEFTKAFSKKIGPSGFGQDATNINASVTVSINGKDTSIKTGDVLIASITSCTNTSNPSVMIAAGLLAKKAVEKGITIPNYVKTSLAPGSKAVTEYLKKASLMPALEKLGFNIVGYGCTTCIGNSGPLSSGIHEAISKSGLVTASIISGNRNFEGRVGPTTKANYLASPPLVVAYALAGSVLWDPKTEPIGHTPEGNPVFFEEIWPSSKEIQDTISEAVGAEIYQKEYSHIFEGNDNWKSIDIPSGDLFKWNNESTYIRHPSFFENMPKITKDISDITNARVLALTGDTITTDHISPAGAISPESPAAKYLKKRRIEKKDYNTYGSRRGNHEIMMRGTFANVRMRNLLVPDSEGGVTKHFPTNETLNIFDASQKYKAKNTNLIIIAGKDYGMGSSRDWAAKGQSLLGVRAVIFESIERIHRSNLIGMGILPLEFINGQNKNSLKLDGSEIFQITGLSNDMKPQSLITVIATNPESKKVTPFQVQSKLNTPIEIKYYRHGGILHYVLRQLLK